MSKGMNPETKKRKNTNMNTLTKEEIKAGLETVRAVADAIRELKQVPAGHLYANLMHVMNLDSFEKVVGMLIKAGLVRRDDSHLLHWIA